MSFLLDTNVISEIRKPTPDPHVESWFATVSGAELYLSVLVIGEIRQGIERLRGRNQPQATVYEQWLVTLSRDYADRVLPITPDIAEEWGRLNSRNSTPVIDGLMAATAMVHGLTFVTRNMADVAQTGIDLLNPFEYGKG